MDALPEFLTLGRPAHKRLIKPFSHEEMARARERDAAIESHEGAHEDQLQDLESACEPTLDWRPREIGYRERRR